MTSTAKSQSFGFRERFRYRFDALMARGVRGQFLMLAVVAFAMLVVITAGTVAVAGLLEVGGLNFGALVAKIFMLLLVPDPMFLEEEGPLLFGTCVFSIFGGLFVGGTLIGIITTAIDGRMEELRRGRSFVAESDHTIILGWSSKIFRILDELVKANENHSGRPLVVLGSLDPVEMEQEIVKAVPDFRGSRLVCRTGSPMAVGDLELVNLADARSIVVLSPEDKADPDSHIIKILLSVARLTRASDVSPDVVVEVKDPRNRRICGIIAAESRMRLVILVPEVIVPRLLVQSCRKRGLSFVYQELFDFDGDEIYFRPLSEMPSVVGKSFGEALFAFDTSSVIGLFKGGEVLLNPPGDTTCEEGDEIIAISENDDTVIPSSGEPPPVLDEALVVSRGHTCSKASESNLVLGWTPHLFAVLDELDEYMLEGSRLILVSSHEEAEAVVRERCEHLGHYEVDFRRGNMGDRSFLETLPFEDYDNILVLPDQSQQNLPPDELDALTIKCLVHVRDIARSRGVELAITSQLLVKESADVASVTRLGDFVVSDEIVGRIIAQLAEDGRLKRVFDLLLTPEDSEIYIKPMADYVLLDREMTFHVVLESARRRGEIAIGFVMGDDVVVNVDKRRPVSFAEGDRVIVVAED